MLRKVRTTVRMVWLFGHIGYGFRRLQDQWEAVREDFRMCRFADLPGPLFLLVMAVCVSCVLQVRVARRCWRMDAWRESVFAIYEIFRARSGRITALTGRDKVMIIRLSMRAALNAENIAIMKRHAHRVCFYQRDGENDLYNAALTANVLQALMHQGVYTVAISYKHTRTSVAELERDRQRVYAAVKRFTEAIGIKKLLFWSDVTGRTVGNWAEQGIEPYLVVPTLRIESESLQQDIDSSFWMTVEHYAALVRGGLFFLNEETGMVTIKFTSMAEGVVRNAPATPMYVFPLEEAQMLLARAISSPPVYYLKSLFQEDKISVLKYALFNFRPEYRRSVTEDGLLQLSTQYDLGLFLGMVNPMDGFMLTNANRPVDKYRHETGPSWRGAEELIPSMKVLDPESLEIANIVVRNMTELIVLPHEGTQTTEVLVWLRATKPTFLNRFALKLEVEGFEERDEAVMGHVLTYKVASREEEALIDQSAVVRKFICFGET